MRVDIRPMQTDDTEAVATIWYDGWWEAHADLAPEGLHRLRTRQSFVERLRALVPSTRLAVMGEDVLGFCMAKQAELYQMYVSTAGRGTGAAQALIADAEARIAQAGHETAWLACAIGNARAMRFYEKCGWVNTGPEIVDLDTSEGPFSFEVLRYEKRLTH